MKLNVKNYNSKGELIEPENIIIKDLLIYELVKKYVEL